MRAVGRPRCLFALTLREHLWYQHRGSKIVSEGVVESEVVFRRWDEQVETSLVGKILKSRVQAVDSRLLATVQSFLVLGGWLGSLVGTL